MVGVFEALRVDRRALAQEQDRVVRALLGGATRAVAAETKALERSLEEATRGAVPGRLYRAWRSDAFPAPGRVARDPTGRVYVNGKERSRGAIEFFTRPGRIVSKDGYLAIPTPAALGGKRGWGTGRNFTNLTPGEYERKTDNKLRFVYRRNKPSLLVLDNARLAGKRGVARGRTAKRQGPGQGATVVVFVLVPTVGFANRFAIEPIVRRAERKLADRVLAQMRAVP